jgi:hypothetical protein
MGVILDKCSREEHVIATERRIHTLKERCRCICNTLLFKKLPPMLVVQMVSTCIFWLNVFPPKDGVSRNINPRELITGTKIDYNKHVRAEFGEYVQVMQTQTTGAIATKPTGNAQGGHWFYSLNTGRMLDSWRWTPLPMRAEVIECSHVLAKASQVGLNFTNMRNEIYSEDEDQYSDNDYDDSDSDYISDEDSSNSEDDNYDDFIAGMDMDGLDPNDPPDNGADKTHNNNDIDVSDEDNDNIDDASGNSDDDTYDVPITMFLTRVPLTMTPLKHLLCRQLSGSLRMTPLPYHLVYNPESASKHRRLGEVLQLEQRLGLWLPRSSKSS